MLMLDLSVMTVPSLGTSSQVLNQSCSPSVKTFVAIQQNLFILFVIEALNTLIDGYIALAMLQYGQYIIV